MAVWIGRLRRDLDVKRQDALDALGLLGKCYDGEDGSMLARTVGCILVLWGVGCQRWSDERHKGHSSEQDCKRALFRHVKEICDA